MSEHSFLRKEGRNLRPAPPRADREAAQVDPTFHARFESKYLVSPLALGRIREFLGPFTEPDSYGALHENHRYAISSLYLDSPDLRLYQQTVGGEKKRFKIRVRTYSDDPATRAYFEVKWKINNTVHKRRAGLTRTQARALLADPTPGAVDGLSAQQDSEVEHFCHHVQLVGARPVVRVKYVREAYQGRGNAPVRITIDTDLMYAVTLDDTLSHASGRWVATHCAGAILEIKFTERFPWWVQELVRGLNLTQQPVPKYVLSLDQALRGGAESVLALGGRTLGPRRAD